MSVKSDNWLRVLFLLWASMLFVVFISGFLRGEHSIINYFSLLKSKENLQKEVDLIRRESKTIASEILKIKTSKSYANRVYKDRYHITEKNESILFFAD